MSNPDWATSFRVLVCKYTAESMLGLANPYGAERPWVAICQDRFPEMHPTDDGFLPPIYGVTREEAMSGMLLTIQERVMAQGITDWDFLPFLPFGP
jgi:hypothetical protein